MPEAPKQNFIVKFFASNSDVDSDQLCTIVFLMFVVFMIFPLVGEAAGKAPPGVAKKEEINMNQLRGKADSANCVINETRMVFEMRFF